MPGDNWSGRRGEDAVPALCSRVFRKPKGNVQLPRNVFLHGRGGARNLTCLYRFEANVGERVSFFFRVAAGADHTFFREKSFGVNCCGWEDGNER